MSFVTGSAGQTNGVCIGWRDEELAYLDPDVAFATAQRLAVDQGDSITIGAKTLWARMEDRGLLARKDPDERNLYKKAIGGRRMRVLALQLKTLGYTTEDRGERDGQGI
jgi:hypothetical protein